MAILTQPRRWWIAVLAAALTALLLAVLLALGYGWHRQHQSTLASQHAGAVPLEQDAYIWQMAWRPALTDALRSAPAALARWRVLLAHISVQGQVRQVQVDVHALQASGKPVIAVVRIEGQLQRFDSAQLRATVLQVLARAKAQGLTLAGLELDYDCPTSKLPEYRAFLVAMKADLAQTSSQTDKPLPLLITALPAWLDSDQLAALWQSVDELTLQVHAVQNPSKGLFDPTLALRWVQQLEGLAQAHTGVDVGASASSQWVYRIALPTYSARLGLDRFGNLQSVESEQRLLDASGSEVDWAVDPQVVQRFMAQVEAQVHVQGDVQVEAQGLAHWRGWVWFRLPTLGDERAWHPQTWAALVLGQPVVADVRIQAQPDPQTEGLYYLTITNQGNADGLWPVAIDVPSGCSIVQPRLGYQGESVVGGGWHLQRAGSRLLKPKASAQVAWARCTGNPLP